jgi:hypothetical protein
MWINLRGINIPLPIYSTKIDLVNQYSNMIVQFNRNIQFTKLIKAEGHLREFNFRKVNGLHEELFTVDVSDDRGNRIMFKMRKEGNEWFITTDQPIPDWVRNYIPHYNEAIEEELKAS